MLVWYLIVSDPGLESNTGIGLHLCLSARTSILSYWIFQKNKRVIILDEFAALSYRLSLWAEPHQMDNLVLASGNNTTAQTFEQLNNEIVIVAEYSSRLD